jgi:hypothetical protein
MKSQNRSHVRSFLCGRSEPTIELGFLCVVGAEIIERDSGKRSVQFLTRRIPDEAK